MLFWSLPRSGGTGRGAGLKIQWYLVPCGFDPLLRDHSRMSPLRTPSPGLRESPRSRFTVRRRLRRKFTRDCVILTQQLADSLEADDSKAQSRRGLGTQGK